MANPFFLWAQSVINRRSHLAALRRHQTLALISLRKATAHGGWQDSLLLPAFPVR